MTTIKKALPRKVALPPAPHALVSKAVVLRVDRTRDVTPTVLNLEEKV